MLERRPSEPTMMMMSGLLTSGGSYSLCRHSRKIEKHSARRKTPLIRAPAGEESDRRPRSSISLAATSRGPRRDKDAERTEDLGALPSEAEARGGRRGRELDGVQGDDERDYVAGARAV